MFDAIRHLEDRNLLIKKTGIDIGQLPGEKVEEKVVDPTKNTEVTKIPEQKPSDKAPAQEDANKTDVV